MFAREREQPLLIKNRHIVSKPAAAAKGPAMAAPKQKALQANNTNRRPLGDIGNLVGGLNAQCNIKKDGVRKRALGDIGNLVEDLNVKCNISKDGAMKRYKANLVVNANKGASSRTQQSQGEGMIVRVEENAAAGIVWGNKQSHTIKTKAQYPTAAQRDTAISVSDSIDSSAQDGGLKTPSQLKARKPRAQSVTATLTDRSKDSFRDVRKDFPSIDDGDIGNLVKDLNAKCNISKDGVRKRSRENLVVNANKGASSSTRQSPGEGIGIAVRVEEKAGAGIVWGNKRSCTIKMKAQYAAATQRAAAISVSDSIDSSAQDGGLKTASQLEARKPREQSLTATLTARSKDSFRDVRKDLPSIDDGDIDNQLAVVEYVEDIYQFYRKTEHMSCVPPDYMRSQLEIKEKMREILIDWMIEVHLIYELMPETLYLTVNIIDRYLSIRSVTRKELQLVGISAMFIASKYEEIRPLKVKELLYILADAYTSKQIVDMELTILNQLECKLTVPTPYVFLVRFLKAAGSDKVMENLAFFLVDLCLLHYIMIKYSPSMLAAAAVYTAQCTLKKHPCWSKTLTLHTGYSEADLKECADFMVDFHMNAERNSLKAVHKKYSKPFFGSVASLSSANLPAGTVAAPATDKCAHEIYFRKPY